MRIRSFNFLSNLSFVLPLSVLLSGLLSGLNAAEVALTYRLIGWGGDIRQLFVRNGDSMEEVHLVPFSVSPRYSTIDSHLQFYHREGGFDTAGEPLYTPVAEASFPSKSTDVLLFAFPRSGSLLHMAPVDTSLNSFEQATIMVINCTPERLAFRIADQIFGLDPLESRVVHFGDPPRQLRVQIAISRDGEATIAYQTMKRFNREKRTLLLAFDPSRGGPTVDGEGYAGQIRTLIYSE